MNEILSKPCTAFVGHRLLSSGPLIEVAMAVKNNQEQDDAAPVLTFDDATGGVIDLDLRGSKADIIARLSQPVRQAAVPLPVASVDEPIGEARGPGRPKLGVVAREVTLLPRHWEWLAAQRGGASAAVRRLVEDARRADGGQRAIRAAHEKAYRVMTALGGDLPGFEEAMRALFADDRAGFTNQISGWPKDLRDYATRLAFGER